MFLAGLKLILQMLLFCVFLYTYGIPSIRKLAQQNTIVIKTKKYTNGIQAPSITIAANSRGNEIGWKKKAEHEDILQHQCENFTSVEDCLNSETYPWHFFIKDTLLGYSEKVPLINQTNIWNPDFTYASYGRSYTFHPKLRIGPSYWTDQVIIPLDKNFSYGIFVHERNFFVLNENGATMPFKFIRLLPDAFNDFKFYYKISAIQHIEKNVPEDPCVEDNEYSFTACVKENLARKFGCRPSWDIWSDQTIRNCTKLDEHRLV